MKKGMQSVVIDPPVYVEGYGSIAGKKEMEGPLGQWFDKIQEEETAEDETWEEAESRMQLRAGKEALRKAGMEQRDVDMIFAGDLLAQSMATSFGIGNKNIPVYGLFGACSTMGEGMGLGAMAVSGNSASDVMVVTSSHFGSAEKEFRFPLGYGSQRPLSSSWTVTAAGACVLGKQKGKVKITGITCGRIVDFGIKDNQNMGACMAPADV